MRMRMLREGLTRGHALDYHAPCITKLMFRKMNMKNTIVSLPIICKGGKIERDTCSYCTTVQVLDIGPVIIDRQISWFQSKHLLSLQPNCSSCGTPMAIQVSRDIQDQRR